MGVQRVPALALGFVAPLKEASGLSVVVEVRIRSSFYRSMWVAYLGIVGVRFAGHSNLVLNNTILRGETRDSGMNEGRE